VRRASIKRSRARLGGYTIVEAMVALSILAVGSTGIVALQKATLIANNNARMLATGNSIAFAWAERLRSDAVAWNAPVAGGMPQDINTDTKWLRSVGAGWFVPDSVFVAGTPAAADPIGAEIAAGEAVIPAFCTQLRLTQMYPTMIRAEIRVFWDRSAQTLDCTLNPAVLNPAQVGAVYLTTGIGQNQIEQ
jgi:type IV pilus assembly protein PilV